MARVNNLSFGSIAIDNKKYSRDVLILANGTVEQRQGGFWFFGSHTIKRSEIERLLKGSPETIVAGTGTSNRAHLFPEAQNWAKEKKLKLIVLPSYAAVSRLNELIDQGGKVAAIIHITC